MMARSGTTRRRYRGMIAGDMIARDVIAGDMIAADEAFKARRLCDQARSGTAFCQSDQPEPGRGTIRQ
jgi:hypothetical protein